MGLDFERLALPTILNRPGASETLFSSLDSSIPNRQPSMLEPNSNHSVNPKDHELLQDFGSLHPQNVSLNYCDQGNVDINSG